MAEHQQFGGTSEDELSATLTNGALYLFIMSGPALLLLRGLFTGSWHGNSVAEWLGRITGQPVFKFGEKMAFIDEAMTTPIWIATIALGLVLKEIVDQTKRG